MQRIKNLKELVIWLLYMGGDSICVGINGDMDISDHFEPKFKKRLQRLLKDKFNHPLYK